jgi:hypothetical protein
MRWFNKVANESASWATRHVGGLPATVGGVVVWPDMATTWVGRMQTKVGIYAACVETKYNSTNCYGDS